MTEVGSVIARNMIEQLLSVHACMNMYRSSNDKHYKKTAAEWLPHIERELKALKEELTKE